MSSLCIIPARGGSKRIPRKNIKDFLGKPIITFSIEAAQQSKLFDEIMVSTDDGEIAEFSKEFGASVPFIRSEKNADDFATTVDVLKEVEEFYRHKLNREFEHICCIYPTAPLIQIKRLVDGFNLLVSNGYSSVIPVVPFSYPIWRGLRVIDEKMEFVWPENQKKRSQDLERVFHDAGQWYWYCPDLVDDSLITANTGCIVLPETEVQDIDTLEDWKMAELKFKLL